MKKKILPLIAVLAFLGCGAAAFSGCESDGHKHSFKDEVIAPTCTENGYTQHTCTDEECRDSYRDSYTNATGIHIPETDAAVDATCTTDGLTEGSHCNVCGGVITEQQTIVSTGHKITYTPNADNLTHSGECANCDLKVTQASHVYVDGICKDCGYEYVEGTDFEFELSEDGTHYTLTKYVAEQPDVVIPATYNGLPVTEIGERAFYGLKITSVEIPKGITKIGVLAFYQTDIISVVIPEGITEIGNGAFRRCFNLKNVSIPSSIIEVGNAAFGSCSNLIKNEYNGCYYLGNQTSPYVYLLDNNFGKAYIHSQTKVIDRDVISPGLVAFEVDEANTTFKFVDNCLINTVTKTLLYGNHLSVIPSDGSVVIIGPEAFNGYGAGVEIPDAVEIIKRSAFISIRDMNSIHIPASVKVIEEGAFSYIYGLSQITVDSANENYYVKNNCLIERKTKILIRGCSDSVIPLDEGITKIGEYAFAGSDIENVILPDSVTTIANHAFYGCKELKVFDAGNGLTTLSASCLANCATFSLHLPSTLQFIDASALSDCTRVTINYDGTAAMWESFEKGTNWNKYSNITVKCTDKDVKYESD